MADHAPNEPGVDRWDTQVAIYTCYADPTYLHQDHLMMQHHVVGQTMLRWDALVPAGGRTVLNGLAAMPAGVPRMLVEHPLPAHVGWCLVCLLPGAAQTTIFHDPATPNG